MAPNDPTRQAADDRERLEQLLFDEERARNLLNAIFDTAVDGLVTIDPEGAILRANRAAQTMFGYSEQELVGRNVSVLMPSPYAEEHDGYIAHYLATGERHIIGIGREVVGRRRDGSTFPLELAVSEVFWDDHRMFAGFLRDLTEQKQLEAEFLQAQKMEALGRLAGGIAHDFNNLLMGVIGCCRMASDRLEPGHPAATLIGDACREAERGTGLIRQLLAFSRKQRPTPRPLLLNDLVHNALVLVRRLVGEDIELHTELAASGAPVLADPSQLDQVLMNLVVNARDAMPHGGRLTIATEESAPAAKTAARRGRAATPMVALVVRDSGVGMDQATKARIFEPFFTTKGPREGTGLGLSTVYGIVRQLGGHIEVDSAPGRGSAFYVCLPRAAAASAAAPPAVAPVETGRGEAILLVEDETLVRASVQHSLSKLGYRVTAAADADRAMAAWAGAAAPFDLLLTDIVLPGRSGPELAADLSRHHAGLRVLFMSAYPNEYLVQHGQLRDGQRSLEKPFTDENLANQVRAALAQ